MVRRSLYPTMRYADAPRAVDDLVSVFGFVVHARMDGPGGTVQHAELRLDDDVLMLGSTRDDDHGLSPDAPDPQSVGLYVAVDDPAGVFARAQERGWAVARPLQEMGYGSTEGDLRDPEGRLWSVGTYRP